tara:strand:+ start:946 stop:1365 length:420 start_codon:yes stop_codon:yes gene_type:complete
VISAQLVLTVTQLVLTTVLLVKSVFSKELILPPLARIVKKVITALVVTLVPLLAQLVTSAQRVLHSTIKLPKSPQQVLTTLQVKKPHSLALLVNFRRSKVNPLARIANKVSGAVQLVWLTPLLTLNARLVSIAHLWIKL